MDHHFARRLAICFFINRETTKGARRDAYGALQESSEKAGSHSKSERCFQEDSPRHRRAGGETSAAFPA